MSPNLKFPSLLNITAIPITFLIINRTKRVIPCYKEHDMIFIWYYYTILHIEMHSGSGSGFVSKFSVLCNFVNFCT